MRSLTAPGNLVSQDLATWTATATVTPGQADPTGGTGAFLVEDTSGAANQYVVLTSITFAADGAKTFRIKVHNVDSAASTFGIWDQAVSGWKHRARITWLDGAPTLSTTHGSGSLSTADLGDGWWLVSMTADAVLAAHSHHVYAYPASGAVGATETGSTYFFEPEVFDTDSPPSDLTTVLRSSSYWVSSRVLVEDPDGSWADLRDVGGIDWVDEAEWGLELDRPVAEATVRLRRDAGTTLSLAPLHEDSSVNRDSGSAYAPLLDAHRQIKIEVATTYFGTEPIEADWHTVFHGFIDAISWASSPVEISARDLGAYLVDRWVETPTEYGSAEGTDMETVLQEILDDWAPDVILYCPFSPGFLVTPWEAPKASVWDTLRGVVDLIGWDLRYVWNEGTGTFLLTLFEPNRAASTPAWSFGPDAYFDVTHLDLNIQSLRNAITVRYLDTAGAEQTEPDSDAASIARYGRRWMEIQEGSDSSINSSGEAANLATAILSDLRSPEAEQEIETLFWWPGEVGDYYLFEANGVHYTTAQEWAVANIRHSLSRDRHRTWITARGAPAGAYLHWLKKARNVLDTPVLPFGVITPTVDGSRNVSASVATTAAGSIKILAATRAKTDPEAHPSAEDVKLETEIDGEQFTPADIGTLATLGTDEVADISMLVYQRAEAGGFESVLIKATANPYLPDGILDENAFVDGHITADMMQAAAGKFYYTGNFYGTSQTAFSWGAGTLYTTDGASYAIAGNSASITGGPTVFYVYWDPTVSTTAFQVTSVAGTAFDPESILIAVAWRGPTTANHCTVVPVVGLGWYGVSAIADGAITATKIVAGSIQADHIAANAVTAAKISVASLSAISADLGTVTAGTISAGIVVASTSFTASNPVFEGTAYIKGADASRRSQISGIEFRLGSSLLETTALSIARSGSANFGITAIDGGGVGAGQNPTLTLTAPGGVFATGTFKSGGFQLTSGAATVSGSRGGNAALASLLTALASIGLITDSTT